MYACGKFGAVGQSRFYPGDNAADFVIISVHVKILAPDSLVIRLISAIKGDTVVALFNLNIPAERCSAQSAVVFAPPEALSADQRVSNRKLFV